MPYNVVIADDEYFIRQRLKKIIPWNELDLKFAGEAENGNQLLDIIDQQNVDIVLLDIKMPQMTGMEAAEIISKKHPGIKIVILSGYDDFSFARSAMRFGVVDYLLKPAEPETLSEVLNRCAAAIAKERDQLLQEERLLHYDRRINLTSVLNGTISSEMLRVKYPELSVTEFTLFVGCFIKSESDERIHDFIKWLRECDYECEYYKELDYVYVVQLFLGSSVDISSLEKCLSDYLKQNKSEYMFLSISDKIEFSVDWMPVYKQVQRTLDLRYFTEQRLISNKLAYLSKRPDLVERDPDDAKEEKSDISKIRQNILLHLNARDEAAFARMVNYWFDQIYRRCDIDFLFMAISEFYLTFSIHFRDMIKIESNIANYVSMMISEEYELDTIKENLLNAGLSCMKHQSSAPSDVVLSRKLAAYIDDNYADPNMTVSLIAEHFQLNPSYMGSVFKKIYNQSLLQYITSVRMEASIRLMTDRRYKVSDIAEMVGYTDAFYYSKRFKQIYGVSPKAYSLTL